LAGIFVAGWDQVTFSAFAALTADHSVVQTTPTKLPSWTTFTKPGMLFIALSSMLAGFDVIVGGRTTRPCNIPGTRTSWA
jgi:hypothetical protein